MKLIGDGAGKAISVSTVIDNGWSVKLKNCYFEDYNVGVFNSGTADNISVYDSDFNKMGTYGIDFNGEDMNITNCNFYSDATQTHINLVDSNSARIFNNTFSTPTGAVQAQNGIVLSGGNGTIIPHTLAISSPSQCSAAGMLTSIATGQCHPFR